MLDVFLAQQRDVQPQVLAEAALGPLAAGDMPVSYTHLRAHETVLDLVCRLLLEKKKKRENENSNL